MKRKEMKNTSEENEALRRQFTANVSHEMKTPLTSILGYAEMIETGMAREEDVRAFAGKIRAEAERLITMISDIIKLSELDEPGKERSFEKTELLLTAKETAKLLTFNAEKAGVKLEVVGEECFLMGNREMLGELIYNLCDNAIRYNRPNGSVGISVHKRENQTVLCVTDTGIGIPPEHRQRIFERFYCVDKSRSKEKGGTGLGLAIVKHIAEQHKATIRLSSREGEGTKIEVIFPGAE